MEVETEFFTHRKSGLPSVITEEDRFLDAFRSDEIKNALSETCGNVFLNCPHCGADEDNFLKGELTECMQCGEVVARPIDSNAEYR